MNTTLILLRNCFDILWRCFPWEPELIPAYVIVEGIESLPTLPEAIAQLSILLQDDTSTAADFEKAVRTDPVITANLLRAANSVFSQGIEPISRVSQAVARIGLRRVFEVAVG